MFLHLTNPSFNFLLLSSIFLSSYCTLLSFSAPDYEFTYKGEKGATNWGQLKQEWRQCGEAKTQSPIDLVDGKAQVSSNLGDLKTEYTQASASVHNEGHAISVKWNEHAGKITIDGSDYDLKQVHWHIPSEHHFNGKRYDLEFHMVHQSSSGQDAVVAVLYEFGTEDPFLSELFRHGDLPGSKQEKSLGSVDPKSIQFGSREYYRYIGSLTTPPCTEGVVWTIIQKVGTVSKEQVQKLKDAVDPGFQQNARPIQESNGRDLWLYKP